MSGLFVLRSVGVNVILVYIFLKTNISRLSEILAACSKGRNINMLINDLDVW